MSTKVTGSQAAKNSSAVLSNGSTGKSSKSYRYTQVECGMLPIPQILNKDTDELGRI